MKNPSAFHSDLQEERISEIALLISQAYFDALDYHLPEKGDNRWSLGCRRYNWVRENIRNAIESPVITLICRYWKMRARNSHSGSVASLSGLKERMLKIPTVRCSASTQWRPASCHYYCSRESKIPAN